jgi:GntR family transcriptional regulator
MIEFQLDRRSGMATYAQLVQQVRQAIRLGILEPGDQLPTAREVVAMLAINPNTVLKAYRELEREGLVEGRPGQGTFVQRTLGGPPLGADSLLRRELAGWVRRAREAGLDADDMTAVFADAVRDCFREGVA